MKIYLAGSIPKGDGEAENFKNWRVKYSQVLGNIFDAEFIDPYEKELDESDALLVFGKDCSQIKDADLVIVYAEEKLGVGTSQELVIAKYFSKKVVTILPKDSPHRKSNIVFGGKLVPDWRHPFLVAFSDLIYEKIEDVNMEDIKNLQYKKITIIDKAVSYFLQIKNNLLPQNTNFLEQKYRVLLIDGENTRQTINKVLQNKRDFLRFNLVEILPEEVRHLKFDRVIWYAAKIKENNEMINFQRDLFNVLRKQKIEINLSGRIQKLDGTYKEKGVDVALASDIVGFSYEDADTEVFVLSSDTDLVPAIQKSRKRKTIVNYIAFDSLVVNSIRYICNKVFVIELETTKINFTKQNNGGS